MKLAVPVLSVLPGPMVLLGCGGGLTGIGGDRVLGTWHLCEASYSLDGPRQPVGAAGALEVIVFRDDGTWLSAAVEPQEPNDANSGTDGVWAKAGESYLLSDAAFAADPLVTLYWHKGQLYAIGGHDHDPVWLWYQKIPDAP